MLSMPQLFKTFGRLPHLLQQQQQQLQATPLALLLLLTPHPSPPAAKSVIDASTNVAGSRFLASIMTRFTLNIKQYLFQVFVGHGRWPGKDDVGCGCAPCARRQRCALRSSSIRETTFR